MDGVAGRTAPVFERTQSEVLVRGSASGEVCATSEMLSFWGGYRPDDGTVIDRHHPLCGAVLSSKIFVLPKGKGSSTGSAVLVDALNSGHAPAGIVMSAVDEIIALGAVVFAEFYGESIPVVVLSEADFRKAAQAKWISIDDEGIVCMSNERGPQSDARYDRP